MEHRCDAAGTREQDGGPLSWPASTAFESSSRRVGSIMLRAAARDAPGRLLAGTRRHERVPKGTAAIGTAL